MFQAHLGVFQVVKLKVILKEVNTSNESSFLRPFGMSTKSNLTHRFSISVVVIIEVGLRRHVIEGVINHNLERFECSKVCLAIFKIVNSFVCRAI